LPSRHLPFQIQILPFSVPRFSGFLSEASLYGARVMPSLQEELSAPQPLGVEPCGIQAFKYR
jgi:hypothetical protein